MLRTPVTDRRNVEIGSDCCACHHAAANTSASLQMRPVRFVSEAHDADSSRVQPRRVCMAAARSLQVIYAHLPTLSQRVRSVPQACANDRVNWSGVSSLSGSQALQLTAPKRTAGHVASLWHVADRRGCEIVAPYSSAGVSGQRLALDFDRESCRLTIVQSQDAPW